MTDIDLRLRGDSSGARAALDDTSDATKHLAEQTAMAHEKWHLFAEMMKEVVKEIVKFGVESVKAYAETEKVQRQLARTAGEYSDALFQQAKAMSEVYAVDADVIARSQVLLTQWGGVGAASEEVTKAALNLAAAMGTDLRTATEDLIRNVESGGRSLAKMGIHFETTGDKGKDLAALVEILNDPKHFGGAASADAASLPGRLAATGIAFEEVKKSIGHSVTAFLDQIGVIDKLTEGLRNLNEFLSGEGQEKLHQEALRMTDWIQAQANLQDAKQQLNDAMFEGQSEVIIAAFTVDLDNAQKRVDALQATAKKILPGLGDVSGDTNAKIKADKAAAAEAAKKEIEYTAKLEEEGYALAEELRIQTEEWEKNNAAIVGSTHGFEQYVSNTKLVADSIKNAQPLYDQVYKAWETNNEKEMGKRAEVTAKFFAEANNDNVRAMQAQAETWAKVGDQIGSSFVGALQTQLESMQKGGEFDIAAFIGDILAAAAGIAGTVIGTYFGQPAVGAAIGNLAAMGIHAGFGALKPHKAATKYFHSGGWVGTDGAELPRYHSGTWIGTDEQAAILQNGERVASRQEVANAGGKAALDSTLKGGGGGVHVTIHAIDSKSAADSFGTDLGRGMRQALRSGRGDLPSLLGVKIR